MLAVWLLNTYNPDKPFNLHQSLFAACTCQVCKLQLCVTEVLAVKYGWRMFWPKKWGLWQSGAPVRSTGRLVKKWSHAPLIYYHLLFPSEFMASAAIFYILFNEAVQFVNLNLYKYTYLPWHQTGWLYLPSRDQGCHMYVWDMVFVHDYYEGFSICCTFKSGLDGRKTGS